MTALDKATILGFTRKALAQIASAEKLIYLLVVDALRNSVQDGAQIKALQNAIDKRTLPALFVCISETLKRDIKAGPISYSVHEGSEMHLLPIQKMIRVQRNDAAHPIVTTVTPEAVWLSFFAFPVACRKACDLIEWLKINSI